MVWVGKYLKNHLILPPYHGQGHLPWPFTCSESCATAESSEDKTLFQVLGLAAERGSACSTFPNQSPTTACWVMWTLEWHIQDCPVPLHPEENHLSQNHRTVWV